MELLCLSSFEKVFYEGPTSKENNVKGSAFLGEKYAIQFAFQGSESFEYKLSISESEKIDVTIFEVKQIPAMTPIKEKNDEGILKGVPGFYPDLLMPIKSEGHIVGTEYQWHSIWVEVCPLGTLDTKDIKIHFSIHGGEEVKKSEFILEVIPKVLPTQTLIHTEWFHTDSIATYYGVPVFSDRYWELVRNYLSFVVKHGQNMILTPLFTPPLDTEVGGKRLEVQLVKVAYAEGKYFFDFSLLDKWAQICKESGIQYLEFSHLFTQWGAKFSPNITCEIDGEKTNRFGWKTDAIGDEYLDFLSQFLPQLLKWISKNGWEKFVYFHISDEPSKDDLEHYRTINSFLKKHLGDNLIMDALSDYDFYEEISLDIPVVATDHVDLFIDNKVTPLWVYYCNAQKINVSNRFFDMPSYRNRILGYQLFMNDIKGFLHWGLNFWYTQYSKQSIDPFTITDAGGAFPSGDSFLIYPGINEPLPSIRMKVLHYAIQDMQALEWLSNLIGREEVKNWLIKESGTLTFSEYPKTSKWQLKTREKINKKIVDCFK
ncbi:DUF4091 domain-containing protein [Enterococcus sp.]|uniref:DUF4091 domain-containing protein n=1 Tax=Enterococcus sp. TaxID=35783 RepID=UPI002FC7A42C